MGELGQTRYLFVSLGADRRLEVADLDDHFDSEWRNVSGQYDRDIVFVDCAAVAVAGK